MANVKITDLAAGPSPRVRGSLDIAIDGDDAHLQLTRNVRRDGATAGMQDEQQAQEPIGAHPLRMADKPDRGCQVRVGQWGHDPHTAR